MAKENSQTFCGIVVLMIFMVFWVSFVTTAKAEKPVPGRNDTKDTDDATERLVQANDNGAKKSTESETGPGFVYIIKMVGTDKVKPPEFIKVGKTSNLVKRRSDLNGGNPFHLAYVAAWKVTDMKDGEKRAHAYLNSFKLSVKPYFNGGSEWFSLPPATPSHSGLEEVHDNIEYFLGDKNYEGGNLLVPNDPGNIVATDKSLQQY